MLLFLVGFIFILTGWFVDGLLHVSPLASPPRMRWPLYVAVPVLSSCIGVALKIGAAKAVRTDFWILLQYIVGGALWLVVGARLLPLLGLDLRDDVAERGNRAALPALCGALVGIASCYAGGNIGEGPGPVVVVFSAGLATAAWFAVALAAVLVSRIDEAVTVERDPASGLRLGALLACNGVLLGNAVVGNWVSFEATLRDFARLGWPALAATALCCGLHVRLQPTARRPIPPPFAGPVSLLVPFALTALVLALTRAR